MKKLALLLIAGGLCGMLMSCAAGKGCPSDGRNIGAERLLSGDKKAEKAARKAGKFKGNKF